LQKTKTEVKMNISKELDLAIKVAETRTTDGAYGKYNTYMTKEEWEAFKSAMLPSALEEYGAGGGDELSEKNGRPPKMACYGSSSRMIYTLSCHKDGFHYDKRKETIERLFGTAKGHHGFRYTQLIGKARRI
jgi:hypothetical protein